MLPNPEPVSVTCEPTIPLLGLMLLIAGMIVTVNTWSLLLIVPPTVTVTAPEVAPDGTAAVI